MESPGWNASCASQSNHSSPPFYTFFHSQCLICPTTSEHSVYTGVGPPCSWQARAFWTGGCVVFKSCVFDLRCSTYIIRSIFVLWENGLWQIVIGAKQRNLGYSDRTGVRWWGTSWSRSCSAPKGWCLHLYARFGRNNGCCLCGAEWMQLFHGQEETRNGACIDGREKSGSVFTDAVWSSYIFCKLYLPIMQVTELYLTYSFGNVMALREGWEKSFSPWRNS